MFYKENFSVKTKPLQFPIFNVKNNIHTLLEQRRLPYLARSIVKADVPV